MAEEQKKTKVAKPWYVYHLGLFEEDGVTLVQNKCNAPMTYKGITVDIRNRLRTHNQLKTGGAKNCKRRAGKLLAEGKRIWKPFYFTSALTETQAKQLEISIKPEYKKFRTAVLQEQKSSIRNALDNSKTSHGNEILTSIKNTYESLNMIRWTPEAEDASNIPLTIRWCLPVFRPEQLNFPLLPDYINEEVLTREQKKAIFEVSDRSVQWKLPPWD